MEGDAGASQLTPADAGGPPPGRPGSEAPRPSSGLIPGGRRRLRLQVRNAQTPIEAKPPWIKTRAKMGPEYEPALLDQVFDSRPEVLAHNVETVPRIFKWIRRRFATTAAASRRHSVTPRHRRADGNPRCGTRANPACRGAVRTLNAQ
jgi:hypothetical protein